MNHDDGHPAEAFVDDGCRAEGSDLERHRLVTDGEARHEFARTQPIVFAERPIRRRALAVSRPRHARSQQVEPLQVSRHRLHQLRAGITGAPLLPGGQHERIEFELAALQGAGDRLARGLLPAAAGLNVLMDLVRVHHAVVFEVEPAPVEYCAEDGPGATRTAPGDLDRPVRHLVVDGPVLLQVERVVRLGDLALGDTNDEIAVLDE